MTPPAPSFWLPAAGAASASRFDSGWALALWVCAFLLLLIVGTMIFFVARRPRGAAPEPREGRLGLASAAFSLAVVAGLFGVGFRGFVDERVAPAGALPIAVTAERYQWTFAYPNGATSVGELRVPVGRAVQLNLTSSDVHHRFHLPALRLAREVLPQATTSLWFQPDQPGEMGFACAEYCGAGYSQMRGKVVAMPEKDFNDWLETNGQDPNATPAQKGERLAAKFACNTCHSTDGSAKAGPTWKAMFGHEVELTDGTRVLVDEAYLKESVIDPNARVVKGFAPVMPAFKGVVTAPQLEALIEYMKSLR